MLLTAQDDLGEEFGMAILGAPCCSPKGFRRSKRGRTPKVVESEKNSVQEKFSLVVVQSVRLTPADPNCITRTGFDMFVIVKR
eukprot:2887887-Amphidinium_carterae.2